MANINFTKILAKRGSKADIEKLLELAGTMNSKTIYVSAVIISFVKKFRDEFEAAL